MRSALVDGDRTVVFVLDTVVEVEENILVGNIKHVDVAAVDVLHHTAAAPGAFEADTHVGTDKCAVVDENVFYAARHFAAHDKAAVSVIHHIVAGNHVLAGPAPFATGFVLARFDADGVIARIEGAVVDDYPVARLHVEGVAVLRIPRVDDRYLVQGQVFAMNGVYAPGRRVAEGNALQQNPVALEEPHHVGAPFALHGSLARVPHVAGFVDHATRGDPFFPLSGREFAAFHHAPGVAVAVEDAVARDGDVVGMVGRDG